MMKMLCWGDYNYGDAELLVNMKMVMMQCCPKCDADTAAVLMNMKMKKRMEKKSPRRRKLLRDGWALVFLVVDSCPPPQQPS